jgi:hypothetical protein
MQSPLQQATAAPYAAWKQIPEQVGWAEPTIRHEVISSLKSTCFCIPNTTHVVRHGGGKAEGKWILYTTYYILYIVSYI